MLAPKRTRFLIGLAVLFMLAAFMLAIAQSGSQGRAFPTALIPTAFIATGLIAAYAFASFWLAVPRHRALPWITVVAGTLLAGLGIWLAWADRWFVDRHEEILARVAGTLAVVAVGSLFARLFLAAGRFGPLSKLTSRASLVVLCLLACAILVAIWHPNPDSVRYLEAAVSGLALLQVGGTLSLAGTRAIERGRSAAMDDKNLSKGVMVSVVCPRCETHFYTATRQRAWCPECRLGIRVEVEEPRCECGYLLYGLEADECPECGRAVPDDKKWKKPPESRPDEASDEASSSEEVPVAVMASSAGAQADVVSASGSDSADSSSSSASSAAT